MRTCNQPLKTVVSGKDLYHRINEFTIRIPDLKERKTDILLFAAHFLKIANQELQKRVLGFNVETSRLFLSYPWPGNLRQMRNVIKYATLLATGDYITLKKLPEEMIKTPPPASPVSHLRNEVYERDQIIKALHETENNKTLAARILGIDRKTLYNKLKQYRITE
jgi:two-component system response regulator HydG